MKSRIGIAVIALLVILTIGGIWFAVRWNHRLNETMTDRYAAMQVGYMIADYVESTGQWPSAWKDLAPIYAKNFNSSPGDPYFAEIQKRIVVNWSATLDEIKAATSYQAKPFPVVRCVSGNPTGPVKHHDANFVLFRFVTGKQADQAE